MPSRYVQASEVANSRISLDDDEPFLGRAS